VATFIILYIDKRYLILAIKKKTKAAEKYHFNKMLNPPISPLTPHLEKAEQKKQ